MNIKIIRILYLKEIKHLIRDKRILISLFLPLFIFPLLGKFFNEVVNESINKAEKKASNVYLINEFPDSFLNIIDDDNLINLKGNVIDYKKAINTENIDIALKYKKDDIKENIELFFNSSKLSSDRAFDRMKDIIDNYKENRQIQELRDLNYSASLIKPVDLNFDDIASKDEITGQSLGNILPMILTLYSLLSVVAYAIEMTTTEKENGTLETIFSIPIRKVDIIISKILASVTCGFVTILITLTAIIPILPSMANIDGDMTFSIEPEIIFTLFIIMLPLIFIGSGIILGIGMFANSYKESSAYLTPVMLLFILPSYVGMIPGIEINNFYSVIPIVNSVLLMKAVFVSDFTFIQIVLTSITNIMASVLSMAFVFKVFGTEKILFGSGKEFTFSLKRKNIKGKRVIESQDSFIIGAISIIFFIYLSLIIPKFLDFAPGQIIAQIISFFLIPLFGVWYLKAEFIENLGIRVPKFKATIGGILLWVGTFILMLFYSSIISKYVSAPNLLELEKQIENLSPIMKLFMLAVTPAICEEVLFRGVMFRSFEKNINVTSAIILTSIFFAIAHMDLVRLLPTFFLGIIFGITAYKTRSIFPSIILHFLNNSMSLIISEEMKFNILGLGLTSIISLMIGRKLIRK